ncbi:MAG: hypothetical protein ACO305_06000 [Rubrivivax sp.]
MLSLGAALWTLVLIGLLMTDVSDRLGLPSSLDAGPLSAAHAVATADQGCVACHQVDGQGASVWLAAALSAGRPQDGALLDRACVACHAFGGREALPHNALHDGAAAQTRCVACHAGHEDDPVAQRRSAEQSCRACHAEAVGPFPTRHPAFSTTFPHGSTRQARFDHASHLDKHFTDPRQAQRVPAQGCLGCHEPHTGDGGMRTLGYTASCAACHDAGIARRDLTLMRWPEVAPGRRVPAVCGPSSTVAGGDPVSLDPPNALLTWLMGATDDDPAAYAQALQSLAREMIDDGIVPVAELARQRLGAEVLPLFQGAGSESARRAACAWVSNREYEPPPDLAASGWRAEGLEIRYARPAHGDPVLRAWFDALASRTEPQDPDEAQRLSAVRDEILVADGPGQCLKCHAIEAAGSPGARIEWSAASAPPRPLQRFDHRPHLGAVGNVQVCASCHLPSAVAPVAPGSAGSAVAKVAGARHAASGLAPMSRETCAACHRPEGASQGCLTCHAYHQDHTLQPRIAAHAR